MQSELKPCPFCGGAAECDSRQAFRAMSSGKIRGRFAIYCTRCNADMGFCYDDIESCNHDAAVDQTIAAWNARTSDAEITRLTEALRDAEEREKALREALIRAESDLHLIALDSSIGFRLQQDVKRARDNCSAALGSANPSQEPSHD